MKTLSSPIISKQESFVNKNLSNDNQIGNSNSNSNPNRIKSNDYRAWERLDKEVELNKVDEESKTKFNKTIINESKPIIKSSIPVKVKNEMELLHYADQEKIKGNDYFRSGDYEEAIIYYTKSLNIMERANLYTNRSLANYKLSKWENAESDATKSIELNDTQVLLKGYFRRAHARIKRGKLYEAINDLEECLKIEPTDEEVLTLLKSTTDKFKEVEGDQAEAILKGKKKRMAIIEDQDEDDHENEETSGLDDDFEEMPIEDVSLELESIQQNAKS